MKTSLLLISISFLLIVLGCEDSGQQPSATDVITSTGTVIEKSKQFYIIKSDTPIEFSIKTFYPVNLPDPFRQNALRVHFSGKIEVDPASQYLYLPFRLSYIQSIRQ